MGNATILAIKPNIICFVWGKRLWWI